MTLDVETSSYQEFKLLIAEYIPIDRDILHVFIGAIFVIVAVFLWREQNRGKGLLVALSLAFVLAVAMEILDLRDDLSSFGYWRWRESLADIIRTIVIPVFALIWSKLRERRANDTTKNSTRGPRR